MERYRRRKHFVSQKNKTGIEIPRRRKGKGDAMSEWNITTIGELAELVTKGTTPSEKDGGFATSGINYIKSDALGYSGRIDTSKFVYVSQAIHEKFRRSQLKTDDILFSMAGVFLGKTGIVKKDMLPANTNQAVAIIRLNQNKAIPEFVAYFFRQQSIVEFVNNLSGQSAQPNINFQEIKSIEISLPPLAEQREIAGILSSLDDKIDLLHRQNKTLESLAETLFRQYFIEQAQPDWKEGKLGDILSVIEAGSRPKGGIDPDLNFGIPSIGAENINGIGVYDFSKTKFVTEDFYKSMRRGIVKSFDVLIYKDGAYIGRKGMFGNGFPYETCTVNEHVFILRANENANQTFLYFLLQQTDLEQLNANSAQPGLNQEAMKSFEIIIPEKILIEKFDFIVKPWIEKIFSNSIQIQTLEKLRAVLLPKLINGELTV